MKIMKIALTISTLGIANQGQISLPLPQYKLSSPISQLWNMLGSCD